MFTGLIKECAKVAENSGNILSLKASHAPKIGDSICVNGACLTVIEIDKNGFKVELSDESRAVLALENLKDFVHIEPSLKMQDALEGHIVQGHIDALGVITKIEQKENSTDFFIECPNEAMKFIVPKGSIAIDGVSLTVNEIKNSEVRLTIISHTMKNTLFHTYKPKRRVNIETDMFARYLYRLSQKEDAQTQRLERLLAIY